MPIWEVPIIYRGQLNYLVEAEDSVRAAEIARQQYHEGTAPTILGNEWEEIDHVITPKTHSGDGGPPYDAATATGMYDRDF
jgi:hypothetical protein